MAWSPLRTATLLGKGAVERGTLALEPGVPQRPSEALLGRLRRRVPSGLARWVRTEEGIGQFK